MSHTSTTGIAAAVRRSAGPGTAALVRALEAETPTARVVADPDALTGYRRDQASSSRPASAQSVDDVSVVLQVATAQHMPVVPRGAGSDPSGGANAVDGWIVL